MKPVKSLQDYVAAVETICDEWAVHNSTTLPWFRGQGQAEWSLVPGLYRGHVDPTFEREITRDFKLSAPSYLSQKPACDIEWLFIMQHYSMPTRLLDWTEHYLTALYFAVADSSNVSGAAVWVLDPWSLNLLALGAESVPTSGHEALSGYVLCDNSDSIVREVAPEIPVAIRPTRATPRITAQQGVFTIHGKFRQGLERYRKVCPQLRLTSIVIDKDARPAMRRQLARAGITAAKLFPDLEGLGKDISFRYSRDYFDSLRPSLEGGEMEILGELDSSFPSTGPPAMTVQPIIPRLNREQAGFWSTEVELASSIDAEISFEDAGSFTSDAALFGKMKEHKSKQES